MPARPTKQSTNRSASRSRTAARAAALLALVPAVAFLPGCGEEAPPPPPPPTRTAAPPAPPAPDRVRIDAIVASAADDSRVDFPQRVAPYDLRLAQAVYDFASAFAAGDDLALSGMLDASGRAVLDQLVTSGEWFDATDAFDSVRVVYLEQTPDENTSANSATVVFAVQESDEAYVLGWDGVVSGDGWIFAAAETTDRTRPTARSWDSDTFTDYVGSGPTGGNAGPAGGFSMEAMLAQDPSLAYTTVEMTVQLLRINGLSGLENTAKQGIAQGFGISVARLDELAEAGRAQTTGGERPEPEVVGTFITTARTLAEGLGTAVTDDQIIEALAAVFQISEDEARTYFENARP